MAIFKKFWKYLTNPFIFTCLEVHLDAASEKCRMYEKMTGVSPQNLPKEGSKNEAVILERARERFRKNM